MDIRRLQIHSLLTLLISVNFLIIPVDSLTAKADAIHRRLKRHFRRLGIDSKIAVRSLKSGRIGPSQSQSNRRIGGRIDSQGASRASRIERVASYIDAVFKGIRTPGIE